MTPPSAAPRDPRRMGICKHIHQSGHIHSIGHTRGGICRQAYHVFNRGLAEGLPVDRAIEKPQQPLAGCIRHTPANPRATDDDTRPIRQQIPALAPKLQSSLIRLGPRKDAAMRPQHGYMAKRYRQRAALAAQ